MANPAKQVIKFLAFVSVVGAAVPMEKESCAQESVNLLQGRARFQSVQPSVSRSELIVDSVLSNRFENVQTDGVRPHVALPQSSFTWQCMNGAITQKQITDPDLLPEIYKTIGITDGCQNGGEVCQAMHAAWESMMVLEKQFPNGPPMVNLTLFYWGTSEVQSWRAGTVTYEPSSMTAPLAIPDPLRNYSLPTGLPSVAKIENGNGNNPYILCEFSRAIVQETIHQSGTQTCGWTASLESLAMHAPARAFQMALRTLWTGRATSSIPRPCPNAFMQQPGLTASARNWIFGVEAMWVYALMSSWRQECGLSCSLPELEGYLESAEAQMTYPSAIIWLANIIGKSGSTADYILNKYTCPASAELCHDLARVKAQSFGANVSASVIAEKVGVKASGMLDNPVNAAQIRQIAPVFGFTMEEFENAMPGSPIFHQLNLLSTAGISAGLPSFTKDLLQQACSSLASKGTVILNVQDKILVDNNMHATAVRTARGIEVAAGRLPQYIKSASYEPASKFQGNCNHWIVLSACEPEKQLYRVWSWGNYFYLTEAEILGKSVSTATVNASLPPLMKIPLPVGEPFTSGNICSAITVAM